MVFYIQFINGSFMAFTGGFITHTKSNLDDCFVLRVILADGLEKKFLVKGSAVDIFQYARNDIINLESTGEKIDDEEVFKLKPAWTTKYMKYGDAEEREKFIRENINLPMQFVDSVEESEAIINCVNEVLALWEKRSYKKEV